MFSVWKLLAGYGVGMSQLAWASAADWMPSAAQAVKAIEQSRGSVIILLTSGIWDDRAWNSEKAGNSFDAGIRSTPMLQDC